MEKSLTKHRNNYLRGELLINYKFQIIMLKLLKKIKQLYFLREIDEMKLAIDEAKMNLENNIQCLEMCVYDYECLLNIAKAA